MKLRRGSLLITGGLALLLLPVLLSLTYPQLATPLVLSDPLTRADAIVALGGGTSRTGQPTSATRERTLYAIGLYREGFAPRLIFSTGPIQGMSEARLMGAIARSAGVPHRAILLENESRNTYENVRFVQALIAKQGWKEIILVSSPYHMRRVSFLFRCHAPNLKVLHAPVRPSEFYERRTWGFALLQASTMLREYAALAWYWMRGYF